MACPRTTPLLVAIAVIFGGCNMAAPSATGPRSAPGATPSPTSPATPASVGTWAKIPSAPSGWYRPEGAFWIDGRLVVVAAARVQAWDPRTRRWEVIADLPQADDCEGCGYSETAVWTGSELLLWGGGFGYRAPDGRVHRGVAVDLHGNVTPLPRAPITVRWWHGAVWTGSEMIVFGGGNDSHGRRDGAAYDPSTGLWRVIAKSPVGGYANSLVWTGREMITWGGVKESPGYSGTPRGFIAAGAAYDPATDRWRELPRAGIDPRGWHSAVWTGNEMIVWGGVARIQNTCYDCGYPKDAGIFDPSSWRWRRVDAGPLPGRVEHTAVWSGADMIVFGGSPPGGGNGRAGGGIYDPASDSWEVLPAAPIRGRYRHAALWNGEAMLLWGGQKPASGGYRDGASFTPAGSR